MRDKYVLMEWEDGWRELTRVEDDAVGLRKYFVIERVEYVGRLVIDRPDGGVPGLVATDRKPLDVKRVALVGGMGGDLRQGSLYKEGGRTEHNFELEVSTEDLEGALAGELEAALLQRGLRSADVLSSPAEVQSEVIGAVAAELRLVAGKNQDHLIGFVKELLEGRAGDG